MTFLERIKEGCLAGWQHGILPSVSAAQAVLESGWGQSALAQSPNHNLFGIKASGDWTGKVVRLPTQEFRQGKMGIEVASFRKYDSWEASIIDHAVFFSSTDWRRRNYAAVIGEKSYRKACLALQAAGYATDPNYAVKLIALIQEHQLYEWDKSLQQETVKGEQKMGKHLVICGHGKGPSGYDPGAVNRSLGITEADKVREFAQLMAVYSGNQIDYITDQNVYDYRSLGSIGKGYDSITELHFNAFNGQARGTEILIYAGYQPDSLDQKLLAALSSRFTNRGIKKVEWLYNANVAASKGYNYRLVEIAFIDNHADMAIYEAHKRVLAKEFVQAITGQVSAFPSTASSASQSSFRYHLGDSVRVEKHATHYQTGHPIKSFVKGKSYRIIRVKEVNQSNSKYAYLLEGINSWVLEQDLAPSTLGHSEQTYTVQKGDTLSSIAKRFKTTYQELARINSIPDPNRIKVGQVLKLV